MHRAEAGAPLFTKVAYVCHFSLRIERGFPRGSKNSVSYETSSPFRLREDEEQHVLEDRKQGHACNIASAKKRRSGIRMPLWCLPGPTTSFACPAPSFQKRKLFGGGKTRLVSTSRAKRLFSRCNNMSLKTRTMVMDCYYQCKAC